LLLGAVALIPFVCAVAVRTGRTDLPVGDYALMDLRVRDVWSTDVPLVGSYSRFGWNHPGPAVFYALAPISGVFGTPAWATSVASALTQGLVVAGIASVAWRAGGLRLVTATLAFVGLAYGAAGPTMILDAWNPNVAYPLFILFLLVVWVLATGHPRALLGVALVGTVLVQAHVGYLPLVLAGTACALVLAARRVHTWRAWRRGLAWSVAGVAVLWIPAVIHELVYPSNVRALVDSLTDSEQPNLGARTAARVLADEFRVPPPWLGGSNRLDEFANTVVGASPWWLLLPALLLVAAVLAVRYRARRGAVELLVLTVVLAVVGFAALARVIGLAERYVFYWRVPLALLVVFASVWCITTGLGLDRRRSATRAAGIALAGIVVFASVTLSFRIVRTDDTSDAERLTRAALDAVTPSARTARVLVRDADVPLIGIERALVNELDREGVPVKIDAGLGYQFGFSREATLEEVDEVWYVVEQGQTASVMTALPGARVLWSASPLGDRDEEALRAGQRALWAALENAGRDDLYFQLHSPLVAFVLEGIPGVDLATLQRVAELNQVVEASGGCRCAVVAFDAADLAGAEPVIPRQ
jgi:hypothetical protein